MQCYINITAYTAGVNWRPCRGQSARCGNHHRSRGTCGPGVVGGLPEVRGRRTVPRRLGERVRAGMSPRRRPYTLCFSEQKVLQRTAHSTGRGMPVGGRALVTGCLRACASTLPTCTHPLQTNAKGVYNVTLPFAARVTQQRAAAVEPGDLLLPQAVRLAQGSGRGGEAKTCARMPQSPYLPHFRPVPPRGRHCILSLHPSHVVSCATWCNMCSCAQERPFLVHVEVDAWRWRASLESGAVTPLL